MNNNHKFKGIIKFLFYLKYYLKFIFFFNNKTKHNKMFILNI